MFFSVQSLNRKIQMWNFVEWTFYSDIRSLSSLKFETKQKNKTFLFHSDSYEYNKSISKCEELQEDYKCSKLKYEMKWLLSIESIIIFYMHSLWKNLFLASFLNLNSEQHLEFYVFNNM